MTENSDSKRVLFVAGGTGGHIVPALAVAQKLKEIEPNIDITFCGVGKEIERKLIPGAGFPLIELPFPPFRGTSILKKVSFFFKLPLTVWKARSIIQEKKISAVIVFGGYPSVCPMIAAWTLGLKRVLHEQNQQVGLANKLLEKFASQVFAVTGASGFKNPSRVTFLPLPIRKQFREIPEVELSGNPKLLILGGSQGAKRINDAIVELIPFLKQNGVEVVHQSGAKDFESVKSRYDENGFKEVVPFIDDVANELGKAWLVISRAGAMSVAEISAAGRTGIYIPLAIAGAHQSANIETVVRNNAALTVKQDEELAKNLQRVIEALLKNSAELLEIGKRAKAMSLSGQQASEEVIARAVL